MKIRTSHLVSLSQALDILEREWSKDNDDTILPLALYTDLIDLEDRMKREFKPPNNLLDKIDDRWACKTSTCYNTCDSHPCLIQHFLQLQAKGKLP